MVSQFIGCRINIQFYLERPIGERLNVQSDFCECFWREHLSTHHALSIIVALALVYMQSFLGVRGFMVVSSKKVGILHSNAAVFNIFCGYWTDPFNIIISLTFTVPVNEFVLTYYIYFNLLSLSDMTS